MGYREFSFFLKRMEYQYNLFYFFKIVMYEKLDQDPLLIFPFIINGSNYATLSFH